MTVRVDITINDSLNQKLDPKKVESAINRSLLEVMTELYNKAVDTSPYRTGKLQESHSVSMKTGMSAEGLLKNSAHYWSFVEFGTYKMSARHWVLRAMESTRPIPAFKNAFKKFYKPPA